MARELKAKSPMATEWAVCDDPARLFAHLPDRVSDRKFILFAVASCYHCPPDRGRRTHPKYLIAKWEAAAGLADGSVDLDRVRRHWGGGPIVPSFPERAREWAQTWAERTDLTIMYQPPEVLADLLRCVFGNPFRPVAVDPDWLTPSVLALAEGIYADRAFDRLPILADALDDAGCADPDVIGHLRGPGPHARGCWVVDLILGKS